jgi:hypothetical protein
MTDVMDPFEDDDITIVIEEEEETLEGEDNKTSNEETPEIEPTDVSHDILESITIGEISEDDAKAKCIKRLKKQYKGYAFQVANESLERKYEQEDGKYIEKTYLVINWKCIKKKEKRMYTERPYHERNATSASATALQVQIEKVCEDLVKCNLIKQEESVNINKSVANGIRVCFKKNSGWGPLVDLLVSILDDNKNKLHARNHKRQKSSHKK